MPPLAIRVATGTAPLGVVSGRSNGRRTQRMPDSSLRRATASSTGGARWVCLCVSRWVGWMPASTVRRTCAASSSYTRIPRFAMAASSPATVAGYGLRVSGELPPTSTRWQPTSSVGVSRARRTASSKAAPLAISVVAVTMPRRCASTMPSFTSAVNPKSSAFTTSCLRALKISSGEGSGIFWDWRGCRRPATESRRSLR